MRTLTTLFTGAVLCSSLIAQGVITRIAPDGAHHFYYNGELATAVADANLTTEVDTILLGGGDYFLTQQLELNQPAVLIGTGVRQDSSAAYLGRTYITKNGGNWNLTITETADGSELHGIEFQSLVDVVLGSTNATSDVDDVKITRCRIEELRLSPSANSLANNTVIEECVLRNLMVNNAVNTQVRNTLLNQVTGAGSNSQTEFQHCVFHNFNFSNSNGNGNVRYVNNVMLKLNTAPFQVNEPSIYEYNLFAGSGGTYNTTFATGIANTGNTSVASIDTAFVANNNINPNAYSITADYHLLPAYQVIGEGGAQPGIYGGADPWKEGQIPFTPHWIELYTPNTNTVNGVLQGVHIKASAQQH